MNKYFCHIEKIKIQNYTVRQGYYSAVFGPEMPKIVAITQYKDSFCVFGNLLRYFDKFMSFRHNGLVVSMVVLYPEGLWFDSGYGKIFFLIFLKYFNLLSLIILIGEDVLLKNTQKVQFY